MTPSCCRLTTFTPCSLHHASLAALDSRYCLRLLQKIRLEPQCRTFLLPLSRSHTLLNKLEHSRRGSSHPGRAPPLRVLVRLERVQSIARQTHLLAHETPPLRVSVLRFPGVKPAIHINAIYDALHAFSLRRPVEVGKEGMSQISS